ncbi:MULTISPECIES: hypothetical protein [Klebsiella]|uniref:hypothetical protein n=1 Tax=Klebsiella TaxID=570 RepID=UPI0015E9A89C|nr:MULTISPECIES: hypothetical protein [Klebsiella]MBE8894304.1 hypothetical protein [Klebsiella grimontii]MBW6010401.1 hypothetical protein [Klebsiella sp. CVUAS 11263]MBW6033257.1 hypothetical protein [Klebsiella sp. CVUAS 11332]QLT85832.1 hypothetical protein HV252_15165 [Klebsiella grimontii]QQQ25742.1 hypothetical protein JIZ39_05320 [Klebsiella grimontii]
MTNNQLTDEKIKRRINQIEDRRSASRDFWGGDYEYQENIELIALRELQERRKASAEPVAYLVCNGRLYQYRSFLSLSAAIISVNDRNDGAEIKALCVIETLRATAE